MQQPPVTCCKATVTLLFGYDALVQTVMLWTEPPSASVQLTCTALCSALHLNVASVTRLARHWRLTPTVQTAHINIGSFRTIARTTEMLATPTDRVTLSFTAPVQTSLTPWSDASCPLEVATL